MRLIIPAGMQVDTYGKSLQQQDKSCGHLLGVAALYVSACQHIDPSLCNYPLCIMFLCYNILACVLVNTNYQYPHLTLICTIYSVS